MEKTAGESGQAGVLKRKWEKWLASTYVPDMRMIRLGDYHPCRVRKRGGKRGTPQYSDGTRKVPGDGSTFSDLRLHSYISS